MKGSHYTSDQNEYISRHYPTMSYAELATAYNAKYGEHITASAMGKKCRALGLPRKPIKHKTMFTDEADKYLLEHALNYTSRELSKKLLELFGIRCATSTVTERLRALGIRRGCCFTPKGYIPAASKPVGTERIRKRTIMVKVAQPNVWKPKAQLIMGYDPDKEQVIYLDGNSLNVTPDNMVVVSKRVHARLAKNGWLDSSIDVLIAGIKWSYFFYALNDLEL